MTDEAATPESRIFQLLGNVPGLLERAQGAQLGLRRPGSPEAEDRDSPVGEHAGVLASMKLAVAGDHLLAFYLIGHGTHLLPTWGHLSLLRGATEGAIVARWLTATDVSSAVRVGRGVDRMLDDYEERAKAEDELAASRDPEDPTDAWPPEGFVGARTRKAALLAEAAKAGVKPAGYPGTTNLARTYATCGSGLDAYMFRYVSGVLHGIGWASVRGEHHEVVETDEAVSRVLTTADSMGTWYATRCALRHYVAAVESLERYVSPVLSPDAH